MDDFFEDDSEHVIWQRDDVIVYETAHGYELRLGSVVQAAYPDLAEAVKAAVQLAAQHAGSSDTALDLALRELQDRLPGSPHAQQWMCILEDAHEELQDLRAELARLRERERASSAPADDPEAPSTGSGRPLRVR